MEMAALILFFSIFALYSHSAYGQFAGGFFSQQSDKKKLMLAQIAGYQTYLSVIETTYRISQSGLHYAYGLKNSSFNLNNYYFESLAQVTPVVQQNPKAGAIREAYGQIITRFTAELTWQKQHKLLSATEIASISSAYANLQKKCRMDLDELTQVLTPGKLQMTDAQRLERLDRLYESMQDKRAFAFSFTSKCRSLASGRSEDAAGRTTLEPLYGIH